MEFQVQSSVPLLPSKKGIRTSRRLDISNFYRLKLGLMERVLKAVKKKKA
jgi:hypothetical protein